MLTLHAAGTGYTSGPVAALQGETHATSDGNVNTVLVFTLTRLERYTTTTKT